jgi:alpha-L-fucosidase
MAGDIFSNDDFSIEGGPFEPTFASLRRFECPKWFTDAKFGIWSHWGPQSVPMFGDWYARGMYIEGSPQYLYHLRKYGHPSRFGYKDVPALWKAEAFDPAALMDKFVRAGAKYFVAQAMHHDNFDNFESAYQPRFNSTVMGPKRDILREWKKEAKKYGLPFGVTEHLGASYGWFGVAKGCDMAGPYRGVPYDGADPAFKDLYYENNNGHKLSEHGRYDRAGWYTDYEPFHRHWFLRIKDLINKLEPDLLYSDGGLPFLRLQDDNVHNYGVHGAQVDEADKGAQYGLKIIAHLYNTSCRLNGKNLAVYTQKDRNQQVFSMGILDIERSQEDRITPYYWQTDTSVGDWFYNVKDVYKPWHVIAETRVDIVSKNGNLLLNIPQKPDGTLDGECEYLLEQMAEWMAVNGEGIHGARHFRVSGEGNTGFQKKAGGFDEGTVSWQPDDVRYTAKDGIVYAFLMRRPPDNRAVLRELNDSREKAAKVLLLGGGELPFKQHGAALVVDLPDRLPSERLNCLKVLLA